jgi:NlpC/P60 family putative phage cell wall peptidase
MSTQGEAIVAEARRWLRTPYRHQANVLGVGVDCAMLPVEVFKALGLLPAELDPRPYATDWHLHRSEEKYLGWVERYGVKVETPEPGDLALFRFGRCLSHGGIVDAVTPDITMIHADQDAGHVERAEVRRWAERLAGFWRIAQ